MPEESIFFRHVAEPAGEPDEGGARGCRRANGKRLRASSWRMMVESRGDRRKRANVKRKVNCAGTSKTTFKGKPEMAALWRFRPS